MDTGVRAEQQVHQEPVEQGAPRRSGLPVLLTDARFQAVDLACQATGSSSSSPTLASDPARSERQTFDAVMLPRPGPTADRRPRTSTASSAELTAGGDEDHPGSPSRMRRSMASSSARPSGNAQWPGRSATATASRSSSSARRTPSASRSLYRRYRWRKLRAENSRMASAVPSEFPYGYRPRRR